MAATSGMLVRRTVRMLTAMQCTVHGPIIYTDICGLWVHGVDVRFGGSHEIMFM